MYLRRRTYELNVIYKIKSSQARETESLRVHVAEIKRKHILRLELVKAEFEVEKTSAEARDAQGDVV